MTLHCLNAAPDSEVATRLVSGVAPGDAVLFLGPAAILASAANPQLTSWLGSSAELCVLAEDWRATGLADLHTDVQAIDYSEWVALSESHGNQQAWY